MEYSEKGLNGEDFIVLIEEGDLTNEVFIGLRYKLGDETLSANLKRFKTDEKNINAIKTEVKVIINNIHIFPRE